MDQKKFALLQRQLESSRDGILVVDPDNKITLTNDRFHRMWNISSQIVALQDDEIQIKTILHQLIDPDEFTARIQYLKEHPEETCVELILLKNGRIFERYSTPLHDFDNTFLGRIWYFRDISETKNMEEEMLKLKKLDSASVLAGGIAHDFNNILTVVLGNIQLSTFQLAKDDAIVPLLEDAKKAALKAQVLTKQLLNLSRKNAPVKQSTELKNIMNKSCKIFLKKTNISCTLNMAENLFPVDCDSKQISQVLQHLVSNAR